MFRVNADRTGGYCDRISRRNFVQLGVSGLGTLALSDMLRAQEISQAAGRAKKNTAVILFWLDGGPSQIDIYDMKPEAPAECRGIWHPISTNVPGIEISEMLPLQAQMADKFSIIRSMHHDNSNHSAAAHLMLTGHGGASDSDPTARNPSICSIASKMLGPRKRGMPAYVSVPVARVSGRQPGAMGAAYLGAAYNPLDAGGDPNGADFEVQNLSLPEGLTLDRLEDRRTLLTQLDGIRRDMDNSGIIESMDRFQLEAYDLVSGGTVAQAFDIGSEPEAVRDRYGRHTWGQSALLAHRLVEAGVTFVTVSCGGWDQHGDLQVRMERYLPKIDQLTTALLTDLEQRGLYDKVTVVMCGEFGRTPKMNEGLQAGSGPGRDHWGNAMSIWLAGGGLQGGQIIGSTDSRGELPKDRPVRPGDLHHTLFHVLGIDPTVAFTDHAGRPIQAIDHGNVIHELL